MRKWTFLDVALPHRLENQVKQEDSHLEALVLSHNISLGLETVSKDFPAFRIELRISAWISYFCKYCTITSIAQPLNFSSLATGLATRKERG